MTTKRVSTGRKVVAVLLVVLCVVILVALPFTTNAQPKQEEAHQYVLRAEITEVSTAGDDLVQCTDTEGEVWGFYGTEDFTEGDFIVLLMTDNCTDTIYDDEVVAVRIDPFAY